MTIQIVFKGRPFIFDSEDWSTVAKNRWRVNRKKYVIAIPYDKITKTNRPGLYLHRELMGLSGCSYPLVDHINRNPTDNRRSNLRLATYQDSVRNRKNPNFGRSKYTGVGYSASYKDGVRGKEFIRAKIIINGKPVYLGCFKTELEAAKAYNEAAIKYFGDFAVLNTLE